MAINFISISDTYRKKYIALYIDILESNLEYFPFYNKTHFE